MRSGSEAALLLRPDIALNEGFSVLLVRPAGRICA
jgi:hypothetical protein